jgi:hypothetical protein
MVTGFHLFKLTGRDTIRTWKIPVTITPERATRMAALPARPTPVSFAPPQFEFTIPKVDKDLPMDGDLKKWRAAGIDPVILITPETASGGISGPEDHSAVVRLAHRDGNLYVQVLKFDDVVTMHQPLTKHYQQDSVELCLNGFLSGFKFNVMRSIEHGETVFRDRFGHPEKNRVFTSEEVPRSIRVLDNAEEVTERSLIEPIYGIDLSGAKVVVTEFKLPLDLVFKDDPEAGSKGRSGDHIWLGMMLNDNDIPGSDSTGLITYPATYNTFSAKEAGAKATFE